MPGTKSYKTADGVFDIPETDVADFLTDNPGATEINSFVQGKDTFDIPVTEVSDFVTENPDAKPLKKKLSSTSEKPTSTGTTDGQLTSEMLGFAPQSTLKTEKKKQIDTTTHLPPPPKKSEWVSPQFTTPAPQPTGAGGELKPVVTEQKAQQETSTEKKVREEKEYLELNPIGKITGIVEEAPDQEILDITTKVFPEGGPSVHDTQEYLKVLKTDNPDAYKDVVENMSLGDVSEKQRYNLWTKASNYKQSKAVNDLEILKARGDDRVVDGLEERANKIEALDTEYKFVTDQYNSLVQDAQKLKIQIDGTSDPVQKEQLVEEYNYAVQSIQEKQPFIDEYNQKKQPLIDDYQNYVDQNKAPIENWSSAVEEFNKGVDDQKKTIMQFPEEFKSQMKKKGLKAAQEIVNEVGPITSNESVIELPKQIWNTVIDAGTGAIKLIEDVNMLPVKLATGENYGWTDRWVDNMTEFTDSYMKMSTIDRPLIDPDTGKFDNRAILPVLGKTMADMAILLYGANKFTSVAKIAGLSGGAAGNAGLIASSMLSTYDDYKKIAQDKGYSEKQSTLFGLTTSAFVSALEVISPNKVIRGSAGEKKALTDALELLKTKNYKEAAKEFGKIILKENPPELVQEFSQGFAEKIAGYFSNVANKSETTGEMETSMSDAEFKETFLMTVLATTLMSGAANYAQKDQVRESAIYYATKDYEGFSKLINENIRDGNISSVEGKKLIEEVRNAVGVYAKMPDKLSDEKKQEIFPLLAKKLKLEEEMSSVDKSFADTYKTQIEKVDEQIKAKINEKKAEPKATEEKTVKTETKVSQPVATEEKIVPDDKKDITGVQSDLGKGKESVKAKPDEGASKEKVSASRNVQAPEEEITDENQLKFVEDKIAILKKSGEYEPSLDKVYRQKLASDYKKAVKPPDIKDFDRKQTLVGKRTYHIGRKGTGPMIVVDREGKRLSKQTEQKYIQQYVDNTNFDTDEYIGREDLPQTDDQNEIARYIAENSTNPVEVAQAMSYASDGDIDMFGSKESVIADAIEKNIRPEDFKHYGDRNLIAGGIAHNYFAKNDAGAPALDALAQDLSYQFNPEGDGNEITPQDIIDFIVAHPGGPRQYYKKFKSQNIEAIKSKFFELTGINLSGPVMNSIVDNRIANYIADQEQITKLLTKEFESYEQALAEYEKDIESGTTGAKEPVSPQEETSLVTGIEEQISEEEQTEIEEETSTVEGPPVVEPPAVKEEEKKEPKGKKRKIAERIVESANIPADLKKGLLEEGIFYSPKSLDLTKEEADSLFNTYKEAGELEALEEIARNKERSITPDVRNVLLSRLFEHYAKESQKTEDPTEYRKLRDKSTDIAMYAAEFNTELGRGVNAAKIWQDFLGTLPGGAVAAVQKKYDKDNDKILESKVPDIRAAKDVIDEFLKSEEFEKLVGQKIEQKGEELLGKEKKKKVVDFFDSLKIQTKGKLYSNPFGVLIPAWNLGMEAMKQATLLGADAATAIKAGMKKIDEYMKKAHERGEVGSPDWDRKGFEMEMTEKTKSVTNKRTVKPTLPKDLLDRWAKRLQGLSPEQQKRLLGNAFSEMVEAGSLSDERFKQLYAEAIGLKFLSEDQKGHLEGLQQTINLVDKTGEEYVKNPTPENEKKYRKSLYDARKASGRLNEYFAKDRNVVDMFATFIQGNLLSTISIATNLGSNAIFQPVFRFPTAVAASALDWMLSRAANLKFLETRLSKERTINVAYSQKGYFVGGGLGTVEGIRQMWEGALPEDYKNRDSVKGLHPLEAMATFYQGLKGPERERVGKQLATLAEATLGVAPEIMFRLLNLGDKPFRRAAERARLEEIGRIKGLTGDQLEVFMNKPDDESAAEAQKAGLLATYQNDNMVTEIINTIKSNKKAKEMMENTKAIRSLLRLFSVTQIPYLKTPLNILWETAQYVNPELALTIGIVHAMKGNRREAVTHFGKAMVGFTLSQAALYLLSSGLLTGGAGDDEPKERQAKYEYKKPTMLNVTGLNRAMMGLDPEWKEGDQLINYGKLGVLGAMLATYASALKEKEPADIKAAGYLDMLPTRLTGTAQATLEQSFLLNLNGLLDAVKEGGFKADKWFATTANAAGAIALPNTISAISRAEQDYLRDVRSAELDQYIINQFKVKLFHGDDLPPKVSMWGEPIKSVPQDRSAWAYYLFDFTKSESYVTGKFGYEIWALYERTKKMEVLPEVPDDKVVSGNETIRLDRAQYADLAIAIGQSRKNLVEYYITSDAWTKDDDETKIKQLQYLYGQGSQIGKESYMKANKIPLKEKSKKKVKHTQFKKVISELKQ